MKTTAGEEVEEHLISARGHMDSVSADKDNKKSASPVASAYGPQKELAARQNGGQPIEIVYFWIGMKTRRIFDAADGVLEKGNAGGSFRTDKTFSKNIMDMGINFLCC